MLLCIQVCAVRCVHAGLFDSLACALYFGLLALVVTLVVLAFAGTLLLVALAATLAVCHDDALVHEIWGSRDAIFVSPTPAIPCVNPSIKF